MARVLFVSIQTRLAPPLSDGIEGLYRRAGYNFGNLLFSNAVFRHIAWTQAMRVGFQFDPEWANRCFDVVVIPAANWLHPAFDFTSLVESVERLTIPVVLIGLGAQADEGQTASAVSPTALKLVQLVAERSALVGVRGEMTAEVLKRCGIDNIHITGCPSFYFNAGRQIPILKRLEPRRIIVAGTRYFLPSDQAAEIDRRQQGIYRLAYSEGLDLLLQSERPEIDWMLAGSERCAESGGDDDLPMRVADYYGAADPKSIQRFVQKHARAYLDVDQWISGMCAYDCYVGSRIHGAIAALLAGIPALLLTHDARTSELAAFGAIPSRSLGEIGDLTGDTIKRWYEATSWDAHMAKMVQARLSYAKFLEANGLQHWLR